jgi:hypothetical protein
MTGTGWPACDLCGDNTPARHHIAAGPTAAMTAVRLNVCDPHLDTGMHRARAHPYRESRWCGPADRRAEEPEQLGLDLGEAR